MVRGGGGREDMGVRLSRISCRGIKGKLLEFHLRGHSSPIVLEHHRPFTPFIHVSVLIAAKLY